jgi:ligand-binding sensor domain-containing protein/signal transduction histidine kinase
MKDLSLLLCALLASASLFAIDSLRYTRRHYTDENGLPQNSVKFIAPDKNGFVWLATENGLVRFDGQHFRTFNKDNIPLSSSRIYTMMPGSGADNLYAFTEVKQVIQVRNGEASLDNSYIRQAVWINIPGNAGHNTIFPALGLPNLYKNVVWFDNYAIPVNDRDFFMVTRNAVSFYKNKRRLFQTNFRHVDFWRFFNIDSVLYYINDREVYSIAEDAVVKKGRLQGDILLNAAYHTKGRKLQLYWNLTAKNVFIYLDRSLYLVKRSAAGELHTQLLLTGFDLTVNNIVSAWYDDQHKRIFLGSLTRGLYVFTRRQFSVLTSGRSGSDEVFYAQTRLDSSRVLTATGEVLGSSTPAGTIPAMRQLDTNDRYSMLTDDREHVWVKHRNNLYKLAKGGQRLLDTWKFTPQINPLYEDRNGRLWIGTSAGLYEMDLRINNASPAFFTNRIQDISYLQQETTDMLWVGTRKGLFKLTVSSHRVEMIEGLEDKHIRSLYIPVPNEVWITTAEDGFFLYRNGRLTRFPMDPGRYLYASHCFMEDDNGYCWITTNKGLFRMAKKDLLDYADNKMTDVYYHYYDKYAGFNTNEFNGGCQPCGIKLPDGHLSFPSMNGLVMINTAQSPMELPDKGIFISRIEVDGKQVSNQDTLVFFKDFDLVKLYVSTPYFGNPYNLRLEFALDRHAEKIVWNRIGSDGSVSLASLTSGTYQLQIRKLNGFGMNNYHYKNVVLVIPLAWYETWWSRVCMALLGVLCIWAYTRFRFRYIKHKNKMLETRIDERTTALKTTLTELQASEEILRKQTHIQERLIMAITHDIKSPLRYMMLAAKRLTDRSLVKDDPDDVHKNAQMLYEAGYRMYHLTGNLLQYINLSSRDKQVIIEEVDLAAVIGEKVEVFRDIAAAQQTIILNEVAPDLKIRSNFHLLGVIIHNLLDNAVKVTYEGQVKIYVVPGDTLSIVIEDTGIGMRPEMVAWCNAELTRNDQPNTAPGHAGFGLVIIKELLVLVNGKLLVSSSHESGTRVALLFRDPNG